jgi:hypothetical protein
MLVNFLLMCVSVLTLPKRNPQLAEKVRVVRSRNSQVLLSLFGIVMLGGFLSVHVWKDLSAEVSAWYFRSTFVWLAVMAIASAIYFREMRNLRRSGADVESIFKRLPSE